MRLSIYIHDFHPQIGHARAMQELLNGLSVAQKASIESLEVVAFTSADLETIFAQFDCPKHFTQIPFPKLKPFLLKMIFYHVISLLHSLSLGLHSKKIGIGIACLNVDIVNVQFIHEQWKPHFFLNRKLSLIGKLYKKLLFFYFLAAEKYVYSFRKRTTYIVIAQFIKNFLNEKFNTSQEKMVLIPSGVNTDEFKLLNISEDDLLKKLTKTYPELATLDINLPIALFVGALERKGLDRVLDGLKKITNAQLIVIGKSENPKFQMPELNFRIIHIPFSKEVSLFYQLSDIFIFPTRYEPFGLVIIEAYAMGLDLIIPFEDVGASEIIPQIDGITFFHQNDKMPLQRLKKVSIETKVSRREERLEKIKNYSWETSAKQFYNCLKNS